MIAAVLIRTIPATTAMATVTIVKASAEGTCKAIANTVAAAGAGVVGDGRLAK